MSCSETIKETLFARGIAEVECLVPDVAGNARGKRIPVEKFVEEDLRMAELVFTQTVSGDWADVPEELLDPAEKDMDLIADESSMRVTPWALSPTMKIIHDCSDGKGNPHPLSCRNVLKHILDCYADRGWKPVVAPEIEFYLVSKNSDPQQELTPPVGRSGRPDNTGMTLGINSANEFDPFIRDLYAFADEQKLNLDILVHEDGPGQLEVNLKHGDALELADQVFFFKQTAREAALKHGMYATFMAKPYGDQAGSAMHIHQSVVASDSGENIFSEEDGSESPLLQYFIGGLQKYTPSVMSLYAPNVNSYRRFSQDFPSSATNLEWGYDNRTTAIRVPLSTPAARRVENRFPGMDCNPYLAFAATLASGYLGMVNKIKPTEPLTGSADLQGDITIARTLDSALGRLHDEPEIIELLGKDFIELFEAVKRTEFESYNVHISAWEREFLLLNT